MRSIRQSVAVAAAVAATLAVGGCSAGAGGAAGTAAGSTLVLGAGVEPQSFDAAQSREAQFVQYFQPVFDTLVRRAPDGTTVPMLATEWEYDDARTQLTMTLRDDVTFTDGTPFDAAAAKANIERFVAEGGPLSGSLSSVESVDAPDETTLVLSLSGPDPALLFNLGGPGGYMQSPDHFDDPGIDTTPVGSGPYVLDRGRSTPGSSYTYVKNDDYWDPALQKFDEITIKPMEDENARLNALRSGQIDGMIATTKSLEAAESAGVTVSTAPGDWQGLTLFDRDGEVVGPLGDVRVRQAINHAVDRQALLDNVVLGHGELTSQIFGPASEAYVADLDEAYPYDLAKARSLLKEAGYADGFELTMPSSSDMDPAVAPTVTDQLAEVGITVTWVDVPSAQYQPEQQSGKYAAAFTAFGQPVEAWTTVGTVATENAPWNIFASTSSAVDDARSAILGASEEEAGPAYQELNEALVEEAWFAPWFRVDQPYYTSDDVTVEVQPGQPVPSIYNYAPRS